MRRTVVVGVGRVRTVEAHRALADFGWPAVRGTVAVVVAGRTVCQSVFQVSLL